MGVHVCAIECLAFQCLQRQINFESSYTSINITLPHRFRIGIKEICYNLCHLFGWSMQLNPEHEKKN